MDFFGLSINYNLKIVETLELMDTLQTKAAQQISIKERIARNFSLAAPTYDAVSNVQLQHGEVLLGKLQRYVPAAGQLSGLDIGCGTGRLSYALKTTLPCARVVGLDLAPGMIAYARHHYAVAGLSYELGDVEAAPQLSMPAFTVIYSNAALQWISAWPLVLTWIRKKLRPRGYFAASLYVSGTYRELNSAAVTAAEQLCSQTAATAKLRAELLHWAASVTLPFPSVGAIKQELQTAGFKLLEAEQSSDTLRFPNYKAFHTYQRHLGARNAITMMPAVSKLALLRAFRAALCAAEFSVTLQVFQFVATH